MESEQRPVSRIRIEISFTKIDGRSATVYKKFRDGLLTETTVVFTEDSSDEEETEE
jgi:hypothetical protein